jgi:uncharacterized protein (TIGR02611 family)
MKKVYRLARKLVIAAVGFIVVGIGIILIPLPGPGLLVMFAGLFILALEFEWANRHKQRVQRQLKKVVEKSKAGAKKK